VLNGKSQGSIDKHLSRDELLRHKFIIQFARGRIFKIDKHLVKLQAKWLMCHTPDSPYTFVLKAAELAR